MSSTDAYRAALDAAVREYEKAFAERAALDVRLAELQQSIGALTRLCGFKPTVHFGLTDGCRLVLRGAGRPVTAVEVRERLLSIGFDLSKYENALASIHTVLKRLAESGDACIVDLDDSRRVAYEFVGPTYKSPKTEPPIAKKGGRR